MRDNDAMMSINVLVVDDSSFFRRRLSEILTASPYIKVVAQAENGQQAILMAQKFKPDVITMDIEMPVMNGISAVREIMKICPTPILMFSSLTHSGAQATLDALEAGAWDFLPKKFEDIARNKDEMTDLLQQRVLTLSRQKGMLLHRTVFPTVKSSSAFDLSKRSTINVREQASTLMPTSRTKGIYRVLLIGASTGGPVALQRILMALPRHFSIPIVLVQHMPAAFTSAFAIRLNDMCKITVKEAQNGDVLKAGHAYLAPGGMQLMLEGNIDNTRCRVLDSGERMNYKPCVDVTFGSAAKIFKNKALGIILTGMGSDGREGVRLLQKVGSMIWTQDEKSCVVYGMPQAVVKANLSNESISLNDMSSRLLSEIR